MGKVEEWRNVPVSYNTTLERVLPEDLPTLLGLTNKLDEKIADFLQKDEDIPVQWKVQTPTFYTNLELITIDLPDKYKDAYEIEAEIEGVSSGYYDPGCTSGYADNWYPPEGDDNREITSLIFVIYDEDGEEIGKHVPEDLSNFGIFEQLLYETDLDTE